MKLYHVFFLILKIAILVQFVLVLLNRAKLNSKAYLITEILFKTSLGIFIEYMMFWHHTKGLDFEDRLILSFAGWLLLADAYLKDLPALIEIFRTSSSESPSH
jgi:hypothetical protein